MCVCVWSPLILYIYAQPPLIPGIHVPWYTCAVTVDPIYNTLAVTVDLEHPFAATIDPQYRCEDIVDSWHLCPATVNFQYKCMAAIDSRHTCVAINDPRHICVATIDSQYTVAAAIDPWCTFAVDHLHTCVATFDLKQIFVYRQYSMRIFCHHWSSSIHADVCPHLIPTYMCSTVISNIHVLPPLIPKIHVQQPLIPIKRVANVDPQHICTATLDPRRTFVVTVDLRGICAAIVHPNIHLQPPLITKTCVATADPQNTFVAMVDPWHTCMANVDPNIHAWIVDPQYIRSHCLHVWPKFIPDLCGNRRHPAYMHGYCWSDVHLRPPLISNIQHMCNHHWSHSLPC